MTSHLGAPRLVGRQAQVWWMQGTEAGTRAIGWGVSHKWQYQTQGGEGRDSMYPVRVTDDYRQGGYSRKGLRSGESGETEKVGGGHRSGRCPFPHMQGNLAHKQGPPGREASPPGGGVERGFIPTFHLVPSPPTPFWPPLPSRAGLGLGIDGNLPPHSPLRSSS